MMFYIIITEPNLTTLYFCTLSHHTYPPNVYIRILNIVGVTTARYIQ